MACSAPDGTRWHVVYSKPPSKRKDDGILTLRYLHGNVVKKLLLFDHSGSSLLADRFLKKLEDVVVGEDLSFDNGFVLSVEALVESFLAPLPSSIPAPRSFSRGSSLRFLSSSHSSGVSQAPVANVGCRWDVLYARHTNKKSKRTHEGVLRLAQKTELQQKVVLCDNEGMQIDQQFLRGSEDITCGQTLQFEHASVEVIAIKDDSTSRAEVRIIQDVPANQMRLSWQRPESSFQGMAASECEEREAPQVCHRSIERIRNTSKVSVQPKRRDSRQILDSLKRPKDLPDTTNSCSRELPEREGMSMLSSTSRPPFKEERSATLDYVGRIQKLNVDNACLEESADDFIDVEDDVVQQKNGLGDNRPSIIYNPDDQFGASNEQDEIAAEMVQTNASPHMKIGPPKCFVKGAMKPFKSPQINAAIVAAQGLPNKPLSLDFQVGVSSILRRKVTIPDEFNSLASYQSIMSSAIIEELNFILHDLAKRFGSANNEVSRVSGSTQLRRLSQLSGATSSGDGLEQGYDRCNLDFYSDCELFMRSKKTWGELAGEDTVPQNASVSENRSVFLKLGRVKIFVKYSRHDIWVISSNSNFCKITRDDFLVVAVSKWHGTGTEGILQFLLRAAGIFGTKSTTAERIVCLARPRSFYGTHDA